MNLLDFPYEPHYLGVPGGRLHYVDEGRGDPMVMVHGNPTWSYYYRHLISAFSGRYRAIAVDHIGCGRSDKPQSYPYRMATHIANLESLICSLDLHNITLVVHDWGGPIGLGVAARHPQRIRRLVLSNTAAFRSRHMPWMLHLVRTPGLGDVLVRGLNLFALGTALLALGRPFSLPSRVVSGYLRPYDSWANRVANLRFVQDIPMDSGHPSYPDLVELERGLSRLRDKPALILWGMRDFVFTLRFLEQWAQWWPEARIQKFPKAGHLLFEEAPQQAVSAIEEFCAGEC